jgi:hypothetical protein
MKADQGVELHPSAAVDITDIREFIAKATPRNKCSLFVMAGLVPAIHVVVQLYVTRLTR